MLPSAGSAAAVLSGHPQTKLAESVTDTDIQLLSEDQRRFFDAHGFLALPQVATPDEAEALRAMYAKWFDSKTGWKDGNFLDFGGLDDEQPQLPQILMPSAYEPSLRTSRLHARCLAIAKELLGPTAEFNFDHAMTKPAGGGKPTPWHQDKSFYTRATTHRTITIWIPLQPVTRESGCLRFIPGSNHGPLLDHRHLNDDPRIHGLEAIGVDEADAVYCPLEAGGATIHHHMTLHGAGANVSGAHRWAYAMGFGVRTATPLVPREFPWNRKSRTAREARFTSTLRGKQRLSYATRAILVWLGLL
jgi:Phytanoyl-CoA dioxygenase (PhyH)